MQPEVVASTSRRSHQLILPTSLSQILLTSLIIPVSIHKLVKVSTHVVFPEGSSDGAVAAPAADPPNSAV
jgi:hypothetical protein